MESRIEAAIGAMRGRRAVLVGDLVVDTYVYGETVRVSREAPVVVVRKERVEYRLGGAANAAANLAALGIATEAVGVVGDDEAGVHMRDMLIEAGVDVSGVRSVPMTTPQKTRILAGAFGTARQQVLRLDDEPDLIAAALVSADVVRDFEAHVDGADVVVLSDYGAGALTDEVIAAARAAKARGTPVCADSRYRLASFTGVTAVSPNVPEAAALVDAPLNDSAAVERAGAAILELLRCDVCLITQGRGGMSLFRAGQAPHHVDIVGAEEVTDVTGAGDTVMATFAASLAANLGMVNGMALANCAAGVAVMRVGTTTVAPAELVAAASGGGVELEPWDG
jgi:rfaE bifunctional protein kinase chain/domain